jgi:hypothetical protein
MNASSTSTVPSSGRGPTRLRAVRRTSSARSLRNLRLQWMLYRAQRRKVRDLGAGRTMNAHMPARHRRVASEMLSREASGKAGPAIASAAVRAGDDFRRTRANGRGRPHLPRRWLERATGQRAAGSSVPTGGCLPASTSAARRFIALSCRVTGSRKESAPPGRNGRQSIASGARSA